MATGACSSFFDAGSVGGALEAAKVCLGHAEIRCTRSVTRLHGLAVEGRHQNEGISGGDVGVR